MLEPNCDFFRNFCRILIEILVGNCPGIHATISQARFFFRNFIMDFFRQSRNSSRMCATDVISVLHVTGVPVPSCRCELNSYNTESFRSISIWKFLQQFAISRHFLRKLRRQFFYHIFFFQNVSVMP